MITDKQKQEIIENKLDGYTGEMGSDMIAMIALNARLTISDWKPNRFIREFSESLGFRHHIDTAVRVIKYLYPENRAYWKLYDKRYLDRVKQSAWIKANSL